MQHLIRYDVANGHQGGAVLFETDSEAGPATRRFGDPGVSGEDTRRGIAVDLVQSARQKFEDAIAQLQPAAAVIVEKLKAVNPGEIEVEFGVKLEAEAGAVITKAGSEAHFKITLKWK
jgi:hypothetical protein